MTTSNEFSGRVGFCIGTGRCGTTFLSEAAAREPDVAASHERERLGATFHMFAKWHKISVDSEGFLLAKEEEIRRDLAEKRFSLECSALLSHSLDELFERFQPKFLLLVRSPAATIASFAVRGWFPEPPPRQNPNLPPSYRGGEKPHHFLGRNIPHGEEFQRWSGLTPLGRLAWFWQARMKAILEQFRRLPAEHCRIQRLEDLDFQAYCELADYFGWTPQLDPTTFTALAEARPNAGPNAPRTFDDWTATEAAEFTGEIASVAGALGYEHRLDRLRDAPAPHAPAPTLSQTLARLFD